MSVKQSSLVNPLDALLGYQLRRASVRMMGDLGRRIATFELKVAEASILVLIHANPGITQSALCRELGIQRANMAPIIAKLAARGLLDRRAVDGRSQALALTPDGAELADRLGLMMAEHERECARRIDQEKQVALRAALQLIALD
jgi:DNA-binding MarR family transcriptional regulator